MRGKQTDRQTEGWLAKSLMTVLQYALVLFVTSLMQTAGHKMAALTTLCVWGDVRPLLSNCHF